MIKYNEENKKIKKLMEKSEVSFTLLDLTGRVISDEITMVLEAGKNLQQIDINTIPSGIYLLKVETGTQVYTRKFVKATY